MILSDRDMKRRINYKDHRGADEKFSIGIDPFDDSRVQPASVDLTLADEWLVYPDDVRLGEATRNPVVDMADCKNLAMDGSVQPTYHLAPGELILCSTEEYVSIPHDLQAQVHGKSSLGRLGLLVHVTAGFIDPGFKGKITLEMYNLNNRSILLRAGLPVCQLSFSRLSTVAENPYGSAALKSKYQDQRQVTGSRYDG